MSRWLPDLLEVSLGSDRLAFRMKGRDAAREWTSPLHARPDGRSSQATLALLKEEFVKLDHYVRVSILLESAFVRYLVAPWHGAFIEREARLGFIRHCFIEAYGEIAEPWICRVSETRYGAPAVAAAIDPALLDALGALASDTRIVRCSIQPALMHRFNAARRRINRDTYWFAIGDESRFTLLLMERQLPAAVLVAERSEGSLPVLLERAWRSLGREEQRLTVYLSGENLPHREQDRSSRWDYVALEASPGFGQLSQQQLSRIGAV